MKKLLYSLLQRTLRKLIDWLITAWLWANKREKQIEERHQDGRR